MIGAMGARNLAEKEGVEIKMYSIIYEAIDTIKASGPSLSLLPNFLPKAADALVRDGKSFAQRTENIVNIGFQVDIDPEGLPL